MDMAAAARDTRSLNKQSDLIRPKTARGVRRVLLVVPGGVTMDGDSAIVPGLNAFAHELATRCEVCVIALNDQPKMTRENLGNLTILRPGRRKKFLFGTLFDALAARRQLRKEAIEFDVVHSMWLGRASFTADFVRGYPRHPWIASVAGQEVYEMRIQELPVAQRILSRWINRNALAKATLITAGSRFLQNQLVIHGRSARWWPLFPDRWLFAATDPTPRMPGEPFRLVTVADHNRSKDVPTMLRAMHRLIERGCDVRLDWIGLELSPAGARAEAERLGIATRIEFHGHRPHDEIASHLSRAHLYVQSSRYESQGVSVCEAAASGLPIVGTAVGILPEIAPDGAIAVAPENPAALADAISSLVIDEQRRRALGEGARNWMNSYSLDWTVSQALEFYESAIENGAQVQIGVIS